MSVQLTVIDRLVKTAKMNFKSAGREYIIFEEIWQQTLMYLSV